MDLSFIDWFESNSLFWYLIIIWSLDYVARSARPSLISLPLSHLSLWSTQALLQRAKIHLKDCNLPLALADLDSLKAKSAFDSDAQSTFNEYLVANSEYDDALKAYERKDLDVALEKFGVLLGVCATSVDIRMKRSDVYLQKGDLEMAIADLL